MISKYQVIIKPKGREGLFFATYDTEHDAQITATQLKFMYYKKNHDVEVVVLVEPAIRSNR